jgi:hypothetical protein
MVCMWVANYMHVLGWTTLATVGSHLGIRIKALGNQCLAVCYVTCNSANQGTSTSWCISQSTYFLRRRPWGGKPVLMITGACAMQLARAPTRELTHISLKFKPPTSAHMIFLLPIEPSPLLRRSVSTTVVKTGKSTYLPENRYACIYLALKKYSFKIDAR